MIEDAKNLVHHLNNQMQVVLGFLELDEVDKALVAAREAAKTLRKLARMLAGFRDPE